MTAIIDPNPVMLRQRVLEPPEIESDAPSTEEAVAHDAHVAHHFDTPKQQFEAAKLGMWLFLGTEFLLFSGLFCLYAVFRSNHPELFAYGSQFLQTKWGFINTLVLILSSFTMAMGVYFAQTNRRWPLVACLALTVLGGGAFMGIKYVEYSHKIHDNLVWGAAFYRQPHDQAVMAAAQEVITPAAAAAPGSGDPVKGQTLWSGTCRTCHGVAGEGISGQGKDIRGSAFIAERTDQQLVEFVKVGRMPFDKLNTTGIQMPPKGGNPLLKDEDVLNIIAFVRTFEAPQAIAEAPTSDSTDATPPAVADAAPKEDFFIPKSSMPNAPAGPAGLAPNAQLVVTTVSVARPRGPHSAPIDPRADPNRPANAHLFFGLYFLMTGLHGLHVLIGMTLIGWLTVRAALGHFSSLYYTPVDLTGLYWHVVDVIWIFLFPLLYLIH
jgi:cytochrome c oxidase subunit 3